MTLLHALFAGRWAMLLLVTPYALVWTRVPGTGGVLTAIALSAAVLYYFACVDARTARASGQARLALTRERGRLPAELFDTSKLVFGVAATLLALVLTLFVEMWVGVMLLIALVVVGALDMITRRWPMRLVEVALPIATLVLPLMLVSGVAPDGIEWSGTLVLTLIGAFVLAGYVTLCLIRDAQLDRGEARVTTATVLGEQGALLTFAAYASVAIGLAVLGTAAGLWLWWIAAVLPPAALLTLWLVTLRASGYAVGLWWLTGAVVAVVLNLGTLWWVS